MNAVLRLAIVVMILVALAVCLFGLRFGCHATFLGKLIREALRHEELEQSHGATLHRIEGREETVRGLIAQQCSLSQALARFEKLDGELPEYITELSRIHYWNWSDRERNYQYIVELVENLLKDQPEKAAVVLRLLEKKFQQLRASRNKPSAMPTKRPEERSR